MSARGYPQPGEEIGGYRVDRRIGDGGMGVVLAATQRDLDRRVALKVIAPQWADDPEFRARFLREARALAALDSPHVVHVYTYGEEVADDGSSVLYLATQLIEGGDLARVVRERGLPQREVAVDLVAQVALGLVDAHAAGLVHRDVKPANVLIRERGDRVHAFLGDFGIARHVDGGDPTLTSSTVGTPRFMAPELHTGGTAGVASDVYSLGCVLWWSLVGQPPYDGVSDFEIVSAHIDRPVPALPEGDPWAARLNPILARALAKLPEDRYPSAQAMHDDLRRALAGEVPVVPRPAADVTAVRGAASARPAVEPTTQPRRSRAPWLVAAAVVLLVGGTAVGAWQLLGPGGDPGPDDPTVAASESGTPTVPTPTEPTASTTSPTDGGSSSVPADATYDAADQRAAERGLRTALVDAGTLTEAQARCVATTWIGDVGLAAMVADGLFDDQWHYVDKDISLMSDVNRTALDTAALACATAG